VIINVAGEGEKQKGNPSRECCLAAELYLLELAQKGMVIKGAKMLATCILGGGGHARQ
jgi:hypothetical protein